jgi:hypothetical protein
MQITKVQLENIMHIKVSLLKEVADFIDIF